MSSLIHRLNLYFEVLPERLRPWRWWVLFMYMILMAFLAAGIPRFAFTWANDDMFGKDDPVQISLDRIKELFGGTVTLGMVYRPVDGDLFSVRSLGALRNIHDVLDAEAVRGVDDLENSLGLLSEVESLINATYIEVEGDNIRFRDFVGEELPSSPEQSRLLRVQALKEPEYPRVLVSDNLKYGMMLLRTNFNAVPLVEDELELLEGFAENELEEQDEQKAQFVKHGLEDYADFEKKIWNLLSEERFSKDLVFMHPSWGASYQLDVWAVEYQRALVISLILSLILTYLLLGSLRAVIWPILIFVSSIVGVLGLAGWTGWPIDLSLYIAFGLVSVAAIADDGGHLGGRTEEPAEQVEVVAALGEQHRIHLAAIPLAAHERDGHVMVGDVLSRVHVHDVADVSRHQPLLDRRIEGGVAQHMADDDLRRRILHRCRQSLQFCR